MTTSIISKSLILAATVAAASLIQGCGSPRDLTEPARGLNEVSQGLDQPAQGLPLQVSVVKVVPGRAGVNSGGWITVQGRFAKPGTIVSLKVYFADKAGGPGQPFTGSLPSDSTTAADSSGNFSNRFFVACAQGTPASQVANYVGFVRATNAATGRKGDSERTIAPQPFMKCP